MLPEQGRKAADLTKQQVVDQIDAFKRVLADFKYNVEKYYIPNNITSQLNKFAADIEKRLEAPTNLVATLQQDNKQYLAEQLHKLITITGEFEQKIQKDLLPLKQKKDKLGDLIEKEDGLFRTLTIARDDLIEMRKKQHHIVEKPKEATIGTGEIKEENIKSSPSIITAEEKALLSKKLADFDKDIVRKFHQELAGSKSSMEKKENLTTFANEIIKLNLQSYATLNRIDVNVPGFEGSLRQNISVFEDRIKNEMSHLQHQQSRSSEEDALLTVLSNAKNALDQIKPAKAALATIIPDMPKIETTAAHKQATEAAHLLQEYETLSKRLEAFSNNLAAYKGGNKKIVKDLSNKTLQWISAINNVKTEFDASQKDFNGRKDNAYAVMDFTTNMGKLREAIDTTKNALDTQLAKTASIKLGFFRKPLQSADKDLHIAVTEAKAPTQRNR